MTSADKLAWGTVTPRKCRHTVNKHLRTPVFDRETNEQTGYLCPSCRNFVAIASSRRGRLNRSRGNAIERSVAKELGLRRVGHFGGPEDAGTAADPFLASVKSGNGYFSERYWAQLKRLPTQGQQTAILVVTDAPGPGHKRRAYVVVELVDWIALHGPEVADEVA